MKARYLLLSLLWILAGTALYAQHVQHPPSHPVAAGWSLQYFADPQNRYSIDDISTPAFADSFQLVDRQHPNFGFTSGDYWFSVEMPATASAKDLYFEIAYPPLDSVFFYYQDSLGHWQSKLSGDVLPFSVREMNFVDHLFAIPGGSAGKQQYYFKLNTEGAYTFPLKVKQEASLLQEIPFHYFKYGLYYGALLLMLLYNLFLYLALRLRPYLYYCLYLFFSIVAQAYLYGHGQLFFGAGGGSINNIFSALTLYFSLGFAVLFTINFIRTKKTVPVLDKILKVCAVCILVLCILSVSVPSQAVYAFIPAIYIISVLLIVIAAATAWYRGHNIARLFLLAWLVYLLSLITYSFQSMGIWGQVDSASNLVMLGSLTEVLLLSLALADRIRQYRRDHLLANDKLLQAYQDKQDLLEHQQQILEQKVSERTEKLQEKQKEVIKQNRQLSAQQHLIEQQNQQLSLLNENLEKIVGSRTGELRKANLSLHKRNQQLEQFAYIISHNLRGPVASIIGLIKLIDRRQIGTTDNVQYLDLLNQSVIKLDTVITDLGHVLTLEQSMEKNYREMDLKEVVQGIIQKLHIQISEARPELEIRLTESLLYSHPAYLESILYNLISNAIKYRDAHRRLKLTITSWRQKDHFYLSVADNGLGINLNQHGSKIFMLYQRFHVDKEGRGMGLYMVKRQLESLGGTILVESKAGEGSTFTLSMPLQKELLLES